MTKSSDEVWTSTGLKPLSVNDMWLGRKTDSAKYRKYREHLIRTLPNLEMPEGKLTLELRVYLERSNADLDNVLKGLIDSLQDRYEFNDKIIYKIVAEKFVVKRGEGNIEFRFTPYQEEILDATASPIICDDHVCVCPHCNMAII